MKALLVPRAGSPDVVEITSAPDPRPAGKDVLVRVEAIGINFADISNMAGRYPGGPKPPYIPGREFAGVREETGERVMGYCQYGACAEKIAVAPNLIWPQPAGWDSIKSAAFPVNYFTAWLLYWKAGLIRTKSPSEPMPIEGRRPRVLIHAAAGGVGTAAVQIGKVLGVETYGTSSSDDKLAKAAELGLTHAINYKQDDYEQKIYELMEGKGVDAAFEMLGGEHTAKTQRCVGYLGRVIIYGTATGERPKFDTLAMYNNASSIHGLWLSKLSGNRALIAEALEHMAAWLRDGKLNPVVGTVLPIERAAEGFKLLLNRENYGKVVLTM
jgi:NADPH2:quinone reductase